MTDVRQALFAFEPQPGSKEVAVAKGDRFVVLKTADGWLKGRVEGGQEGWAPESYFAACESAAPAQRKKKKKKKKKKTPPSVGPTTDVTIAASSSKRKTREKPVAAPPPPSPAAGPSPLPAESTSSDVAVAVGRRRSATEQPSATPKIRITGDAASSSSGHTSKLLAGLPASFLSQFPSSSSSSSPGALSPRGEASQRLQHRSGEHKPVTGETGLAYYNDIVRQGWLQKKGDKRHNWLRRWFVLQGSQLSYYTGSDMTAKKGAIDLSAAVDCRVEPDAEKPNMFLIQLPGRIYHCRAEDFEDMRHWIRVLTHSIKAQHR